jgi:hypothetical protein
MQVLFSLVHKIEQGDKIIDNKKIIKRGYQGWK